MTNVRILNEEEQKNLYQNNNEPPTLQEISGMGVGDYEDVNEDDLMALILKTNNVQPSTPSTTDTFYEPPQKPELVEEPIIKESQIQEPLKEQKEEESYIAPSPELISKPTSNDDYNQQYDDELDDDMFFHEDELQPLENEPNIQENNQIKDDYIEESRLASKEEYIIHSNVPLETLEPMIQKEQNVKTNNTITIDMDQIKKVIIYFILYNITSIGLGLLLMLLFC